MPRIWADNIIAAFEPLAAAVQPPRADGRRFTDRLTFPIGQPAQAAFWKRSRHRKMATSAACGQEKRENALPRFWAKYCHRWPDGG